MFINLEQHIAQATNLIFFIPSALVSIIWNWNKKLIQFKNAFILIPYGILGSICGSIISQKLSVNILKKFFGSFLIFISIYEIYSYYKLYIKSQKRHNKFK